MSGANTNQSARPTIVPSTAPIAPDDGAVGQQHESEVLLRRADRGEHAELAEPSLCDDREACGGDQRGQEQEDGGHGEHRQRARPPASFRRVLGPATSAERAVVARRVEEGADRRRRSASTRTVTRSGAPADEGETRANSSLRLRGFSTMPTTVRRRPSRASASPDLEREELGHAVGDGDLARAHRVAALAECEQLARRTRRAGPGRGTPPSRRRRGRRTSGSRSPRSSRTIPRRSRAPPRAFADRLPSNLSRWLAEPNSASSAAPAL